MEASLTRNFLAGPRHGVYPRAGGGGGDKQYKKRTGSRTCVRDDDLSYEVKDVI